ncbi:DUF4097 family beta strand repeat-containing protein [Leuconostocaceae bacterium ESL0958]|nr:DUF4097 family beta strand repeat-containing protein [Leuconostocaceae bacterium ESL0958]
MKRMLIITGIAVFLIALMGVLVGKSNAKRYHSESFNHVNYDKLTIKSHVPVTITYGDETKVAYKTANVKVKVKQQQLEITQGGLFTTFSKLSSHSKEYIHLTIPKDKQLKVTDISGSFLSIPDQFKSSSLYLNSVKSNKTININDPATQALHIDMQFSKMTIKSKHDTSYNAFYINQQASDLNLDDLKIGYLKLDSQFSKTWLNNTNIIKTEKDMMFSSFQ